ncbi:MAG: hypothetical protein BVN30_05960 [Proteobacteria bacterium ST_bin16]|nr:MAG: hypothetical protein BVN30_05960 [Proteobacteria bacterium ST_bin16]
MGMSLRRLTQRDLILKLDRFRSIDHGEITAEQAADSASILLCSDGLNEALDDAQIAALFANEV